MNSTVTGPLQIDISFYGYTPTKAICLTFVILFGISTTIHLLQAIANRRWYWLLTAVFAGCGEVLGWSSRLWSSFNPSNEQPYLIETVALIIAPTPFVAGIFIVFGRVVQRLGPQYSRLTPSTYSRVFIISDILCLLIQAIGGGRAAGASSASDTSANVGGWIMLGGIILQMLSLTMFSTLAIDFFARYHSDRPFRVGTASRSYPESFQDNSDPKLQVLVRGICMSTFFLLLRAIYRTAELTDGLNGIIIRTQIYFVLFDGVVVLLSFCIMNLAYPANTCELNTRPETVMKYFTGMTSATSRSLQTDSTVTLT